MNSETHYGITIGYLMFIPIYLWGLTSKPYKCPTLLLGISPCRLGHKTLFINCDHLLTLHDMMMSFNETNAYLIICRYLYLSSFVDSLILGWKCHLTHAKITILKIRQLHGHLIFILGIPLHGKESFFEDQAFGSSCCLHFSSLLPEGMDWTAET